MTTLKTQGKQPSSIAVVIVSYGHEDILRKLLLSIRSQLLDHDKLVVVDNHPNKKGALVARESGAVDLVVENVNNGFSSGCNVGANAVREEVEILFFINPDTEPSDNVISVIRNNQYKYAITMPLLTLPNGNVNSAGNVVHTSGLSWCAGLGDDCSLHGEETTLFVASGACLAVSVEWWNKLGGMEERYFMYYEDTDFSTRAILLGGSIGLLPEARVVHDYEYQKGSYKWFYLERNRLLYIVRCWPAGIITVLLPQLLIVEIALWGVAVIQKRFRLKLKSFMYMLKELPFAFRTRLQIQNSRVINSKDFYETLASDINNPSLGSISNNVFVNSLFATYYNLAGVIIGVFSHSKS